TRRPGGTELGRTVQGARARGQPTHFLDAHTCRPGRALFEVLEVRQGLREVVRDDAHDLVRGPTALGSGARNRAPMRRLPEAGGRAPDRGRAVPRLPPAAPR